PRRSSALRKGPRGLWSASPDGDCDDGSVSRAATCDTYCGRGACRHRCQRRTARGSHLPGRIAPKGRRSPWGGEHGPAASEPGSYCLVGRLRVDKEFLDVLEEEPSADRAPDEGCGVAGSELDGRTAHYLDADPTAEDENRLVLLELSLVDRGLVGDAAAPDP